MAGELLRQSVDEMQEYYDERSEEWLETERADEHQEKLHGDQGILDHISELSL